MNTESIKKRADLMLEEAKSILQRTNNFVSTFNGYQLNFTTIVGKEILKEIEIIEEQIFDKVKKEELRKEWTPRRLILTDGGAQRLSDKGEEEIFVVGYPYESKEGSIKYTFNACKFKKEDAFEMIKRMKAKSEREFLYVNEFKNRIERLKAKIIEGRLEELPKKSPDLIVYNLLGSESELWESIR